MEEKEKKKATQYEQNANMCKYNNLTIHDY